MQEGCTAHASRLMFKGSKTISTWSEKRCIIDRDNFIETIFSSLLGKSKSEEERSNTSMPRGVSQ